MASRPVEIEFVAKVADYLRDVKKMEVSTDDVAEALVAVTNSSDDLERKLGRAMKEAAKDTETLERAIKSLPDATDDAARRMDDDFDRIGDEAKDAGKEAGQEFTQNLGSALASGDLSGVVQETLGGLVSGINGATGAVVGAVGGLALAAWSVLKAESEKQKQELADLFDLTDLITGAIDKTRLMEEAISDLAGGDLGAGLDRVKELATTLGIPISDVTAMLTGETSPAIAAMVESLRDSNRELNTQWITTKSITDEDRKIVDAQQTILDQHDQQVADLEVTNERTKTWQQGLVGVNTAVVDVNASLGKIDVNMDNAITKADDLALKSADINMDGYLDSVELAKAGIQEAIDKAVELDQVQFAPKRVKVVFDFSDPYWAKQFRDPSSSFYNPGHAAISDAYRRKYGVP